MGRWALGEGNTILFETERKLVVCNVELALVLSVSAYDEDSGIRREQQGQVKSKKKSKQKNGSWSN